MAFPALAPVSVREFGVGWDNTVCLVNNSLVFRFPRRRIAVPLIETEVRLLPWLSEQVPLAIPNPCYVGSPSTDYPCMFAGYSLIPGHSMTAAKVTDDARQAMARPLAQFLAALHSISPEEARVRGAAQDPIRRLDATRHRSTAMNRLNALSATVMP